MKTHASEGQKIVHQILEGTDDKYFQQIAENVAHYHHERIDGSGYPDKLKGKDIPFPARIVTVCDTFDAMTSDRSYRKALSDQVAIQELIDNKGTQFDPIIVDAFISLYNTFQDTIRNHIEELKWHERNK